MSSGCEYCGYDWDKGHNAVCVMNDVDRLEAENKRLRALLRRYRTETPLGHQPHMIAHEVDEALALYEQKEDNK